jgi:hypothetical protein
MQHPARIGSGSDDHAPPGCFARRGKRFHEISRRRNPASQTSSNWVSILRRPIITTWACHSQTFGESRSTETDAWDDPHIHSRSSKLFGSTPLSEENLRIIFQLRLKETMMFF